MAATFTPVTPQIAQYLAQHFSAEDDFLQQLRQESLAAGMPPINIGGEQGAFLQLFLKAIQARYVLEIGSLGGYSAITMAKALCEDGKVVCVEKNEAYCEFINRKVKEANLEHIIEIHCSSAKEFLQDYRPSYQFDFAFIDADKAAYPDYFSLILPLIRTHGIICADNTLAWGDIAKEKTESELPVVYAIQRYNTLVTQHKKVQSSLLPLGDGMTFSIKLE